MYLIIGCGLSGIVMAERIANTLNEEVLIIESRNHIGGNCYDEIDEETNILINKYGAHFFHTDDEGVWNYINKFGEWVRWEHNVLSKVNNKLVPIPVNITTVNILCNTDLKNKQDMDLWKKENQVQYNEITNSEEMAKSRIGINLYEKLIKDYTYKQWKKYPEELDPSVLKRIPVRDDFDTRYFSSKYQYLPKNGYTKLFKEMLKNPKIKIKLNTNFFDFKKNHDINRFKKIIYTGPIDSFFGDIYEKLEYRSIDFKIERYKNMNFYQSNSVINYPSIDFDFTRIVEYKHILNQESKDTIIVKEFTNDTGEPYYPIPNKRNLDLYEKYKKLANSKNKDNIYFLGRLANYKYINMDQAIRNALDFDLN
jgi:UDP-galactopyranose mutase